MRRIESKKLGLHAAATPVSASLEVERDPSLGGMRPRSWVQSDAYSRRPRCDGSPSGKHFRSPLAVESRPGPSASSASWDRIAGRGPAGSLCRPSA